MTEKVAGHYYEVRMRLRGQLSHHHWKLQKPFTKSQEDAWDLLNEMDQIIKILEHISRSLLAETKTELAFQVRHTLEMHQPAWKGKPMTSLYAENQGDASTHG